jgi:hypothetical protein
MVAANKEATEPRVLFGKLEVITSKNCTVATMTWLTVMKYLCPKRPRICSTCRTHFPVLSSFATYYRVCKKSNTTGATSGTGIAYPSGAPEFTSCYSILSFICMFYRSLFVLLYFFFWPLCCLLFFVIRILIWYLQSLCL